MAKSSFKQEHDLEKKEKKTCRGCEDQKKIPRQNTGHCGEDREK
ncbi:hypothetical protein BVRB_1g021590 [Beta vulgaris subsp. vulgaris]|uniref:Uncharacterized protein n=1 Tax=Beta vulgaris subsp. vulgaris TaxID=3555 RepID=A0A0J8BEB4_BETVV|nr:hypothetical protein BVRB_1g021590 [Beta vulgaris subsp. vulgaris]